MGEILAYFSDFCRYPRQRDYARMGMGIRDRARLAGNPWKHHLTYSRSFIRQNAREGGSIALLGAGRLIDVDTIHLAHKFSHVHLVDYDPGCRREWDKVPRGKAQFTYHIREVTGAMETWTEILRRSCKGSSAGVAAIKEALETVVSLAIPNLNLPKAETIVSLNLLSQIPLYWRDRVLAIATRVGVSEETLWSELGPALEHTMSVLQQIHITQIFSAGSRRILIITDTEFYYYTPEQAKWQVEPALSSKAAESLREAAGFSRVSEDCWLWHLVPADSGLQDYGEIHRVEALAFDSGKL